MKFFCLHNGYYEGVKLRLDQLKTACDQLNLEFIPLDSQIVDYSDLPMLTKTDLLYNATIGSETLESLLLNEKVTTFYTKNPTYVQNNSDTIKYSIIHQKLNVKMPKTVFNITADRQLLKKYVERLGGFPVIIKSTRSTKGIGTIKIESWQNLISTVDYLITTGDNFVMREFIKNNGTARLIVLGNEVIASVFRQNIEDDFRVSGQKTAIRDYNRKFDKSILAIATEATKMLGFETAGVDIIFDKHDQPYLLEVNFPHDFTRPQLISGVDIVKKSLQFLMDKALKV
uniref:ATP-grasp domain-containing protein n=1 Tax=Pedobacter schmidteae TaxID=2201271 RepID=UPI000EB35462|nr:ATP-grasp domain-containing protein [Pedobacter schmidteae]